MTGFNIQNFISNGLKLGGARPTLFRVRIPSPPPGVGADAAKGLEFLVHSATLPDSIINEVDVPYFGRKIKLAGDRVYNNWSISIFNDEDFAAKAMFENWHNKMNTIISNRLDPTVFPLGYKVQAEVQQFGKVGPGDDTGVIRSYVFYGMFPITVDITQVDWNSTNTIEVFNVTLAYDYWVPGILGQGEPYSPLLSPA